MRPASGDAEGAARAQPSSDFENSAMDSWRQEPCVGPSIMARTRSRIARSRPPAARSRGRSEAERLERATRELQNEARRPLLSRRTHSSSHDARSLAAWRERPQSWPRARSQTRSDLVVAHATFLRLSASSSTTRPRTARTAARSLSSTTHTRCFSYGVVSRDNATRLSRVSQARHGTSRGNTSRGGAFLPWFP